MKFNVLKYLSLVFVLCALTCVTACKKSEPTPEQPTPVTPELPNMPIPIITSISSNSGSYGDYLTLNGSDFGATVSENQVKVNGKEAYVYQASSTKIIFVVPKGAGNGAVTVTVKGKTAINPNFTYIKGLFVSKFLGNGNTGYLDGKGADAKLGFSNYTQLVVDNDDNIYSNDVASVIRKTTPDATISTIAGNADDVKMLDGPIATARFGIIRNIAIDKQKNIYLTEEGMGGSFRKISSNGIVSTILKDDQRWPSLLAIDANDNQYVLLGNEKTILKVNSLGVTVGTYGPFNLPDGFGFKMLIDSKNNLYFLGNSATAIYKVTLAGNVSVLAGKNGESANVDGLGGLARFNYVNDFIIDKDDNIYMLQHSQQDLIRKVTPDGTVTTLYKKPSSAIVYTWPIDDTGKPLSNYKIPTGAFARDSKGNFYIWDEENYVAMKCQFEQ